MPQQINLCTPILLTQKRYFSARTMTQTLGLFVLGGGVLCGYWVWSLNSASEGLRQTLNMHARDLESLRIALNAAKAAAAPIDASRNEELAARRAELQQREQLLAELQRDLYREGFGHSARLQLVAQSIPPLVWVSQVSAEGTQLGLRGYTLEPSELNAWVDRLGASPLMQGQRLASIKVEKVSGDSRNARQPALTVPATASRPLWSFDLVSGAAPAAAAASAGARS